MFTPTFEYRTLPGVFGFFGNKSPFLLRNLVVFQQEFVDLIFQFVSVSDFRECPLHSAAPAIPAYTKQGPRVFPC